MYYHHVGNHSQEVKEVVLTYNLSFKVICDFQGQTYSNHAISPLLWDAEIQYV